MDPVSNLELSNFAIMPSIFFFFIMSLFYANVPTCLFAPATLISGGFSCGKTASKQLRRPLIVLAVSVLAAMTYGHENCRVCFRTRSHDSVIFAYFSD